MRGRVEVEAGQHTDQGKVRERNEDSFAVPPPWVDGEKLQAKGMLYMVADGMGGHVAGLAASHTAVERIVQEYYSDPDPDAARSLDQAIRAANDDIYRKSEEDPAFSGMGSTVLAVVVRGDELLVANVGDSRAYSVRGKSIRQISRDHTWVQEQVDAGSITPEEARTHPRRHVITRSLGSRPDVRIDLFSERLEAGDTILLCSDGIFGQVSDGEIAEILVRNSPQKAANKLVNLANSRGGPDNSTAVVIQVQRTPSSVGSVARRPRVSSLAPIAGGVLATVGVVLAMVYLATSSPGPDATLSAAGTEPALSPASVITPTETISQTFPTPSVTELACYHPHDWVLYEIQEGDNVSKLATEYGISEQDIIEYNCLANPDIIYGGQTLYLPPSLATPTATLTASPSETPVPTWTETATPTPTLTPATPTATSVTAMTGRIAFVCGEDICTFDVESSEAHRLTHDQFKYEAPSWSPNGTQIACAARVHGNWDIYVMNWNGTGQTNITNSRDSDEMFPAWSPDGRRIAFSSDRNGDIDVWIMNAGGSGQVNLTENPGPDNHPTWSPDGRRIAFTSWRAGNADIYVVDVEGGKAKALTTDLTDDQYASWSPVGGLIAFSSMRDGHYDIYVVDETGGNLLNLTGDRTSYDVQPAWSPDGQHIVFVCGQQGQEDICVMAADGSDPTTVISGGGSDRLPTWGWCLSR
jgi:serine/threonine protein phosphatase PrpC